MTIEQIAFDALLANATVQAIVGDRIYPDWNAVPQDPNAVFDSMVVFQLEGSEPERALSDRSQLFRTSRYSFQCSSTDSDQKVDLAEAVIGALWEVQANVDIDGILIHDTNLENCRDEPNEQSIGTEIRIRTVYWVFIWQRSS